MTPSDARRVLEGVPRIGFDVHLCPFVGSLCSCMEYLGAPPDYDYLMGVTGAAFRRSWNRDDGGNVDLLHYGEEPVRRAFRALGYRYGLAPHADRAGLTRAIVASVDRGVPALVFGVVGPPECGVVAGYADDGDTLIGWSYFQDPVLPGYYEQQHWYDTASFGWENGAVLIGEKLSAGAPDPRDLLPATLDWILHIGRGDVAPPDHTGGLQAYADWAAALEVDADYPADAPDILATRAMIHGDQVVMLEERGYGANFLMMMADSSPAAAAELRQAAELYRQVAAYVPRVWYWGADMGPDVQQGLVARETRVAIAAAVREAAATESRALDHVEGALRRLA